MLTSRSLPVGVPMLAILEISPIAVTRSPSSWRRERGPHFQSVVPRSAGNPSLIAPPAVVPAIMPRSAALSHRAHARWRRHLSAFAQRAAAAGLDGVRQASIVARSWSAHGDEWLGTDGET